MGPKSMLLEFSVAHINFIVVALVNISNKYNTCVALNFYPNMQKKNPHFIHIGKPLESLIWKVVWVIGN